MRPISVILRQLENGWYVNGYDVHADGEQAAQSFCRRRSRFAILSECAVEDMFQNCVDNDIGCCADMWRVGRHPSKIRKCFTVLTYLKEIDTRSRGRVRRDLGGPKGAKRTESEESLDPLERAAMA